MGDLRVMTLDVAFPGDIDVMGYVVPVAAVAAVVVVVALLIVVLLVRRARKGGGSQPAAPANTGASSQAKTGPKHLKK